MGGEHTSQREGCGAVVFKLLPYHCGVSCVSICTYGWERKPSRLFRGDVDPQPKRPLSLSLFRLAAMH